MFRPERIDAGFDRELQRRSTTSVACIEGRAPRDQFLYDPRPCAPGGNMEGRAVGGNAEIAVALAIECAGIDAAVQEIPHALRVAIPRELCEQSSTFLNQL